MALRAVKNSISTVFRNGGQQTKPAPRAITVDDAFQIKVVDPQISADGTWVAYTLENTSLKKDKSQTQIWTVPSAGGEAIAVTAENETSMHPRWSPDGKYLAFLSGRNNGKTQVYLLNRRGGEAQKVTDTVQDVEDYAWAPDSKRIVVVLRDPKPEEIEEAEERTKVSVTSDSYPLRDHFNALAAHLAFGSTTEITRRFTRELMLAATVQRAQKPYSSFGEGYMTKQKSPHRQTQQNTKPEQSHFEADQAGAGSDSQIYAHMSGAETGSDRTPRKLQEDAPARNTEPESSADVGSVSTRTPRRPVQGITSHSAEEESERQEKVVNDRPDVRAGVNRSK